LQLLKAQNETKSRPEEEDAKHRTTTPKAGRRRISPNRLEQRQSHQVELNDQSENSPACYDSKPSANEVVPKTNGLKWASKSKNANVKGFAKTETSFQSQEQGDVREEGFSRRKPPAQKSPPVAPASETTAPKTVHQKGSNSFENFNSADPFAGKQTKGPAENKENFSRDSKSLFAHPAPGVKQPSSPRPHRSETPPFNQKVTSVAANDNRAGTPFAKDKPSDLPNTAGSPITAELNERHSSDEIGMPAIYGKAAALVRHELCSCVVL